MEPDFTSACAKLEWANNKLIELDAIIRAYSAKNPFQTTVHLDDAEPGIRWYVLDQIQEVPAAIGVEIGAIIASIRDSLDHLIVALSIGNGGKEMRQYAFAIAEDEAKFRAASKRMLAALTDVQRAKIAILHPYAGGNDDLYLLHQMNNSSKHRALVPLLRTPRQTNIRGNGFCRRFSLFDPDHSPYPGHAAIRLDADEGVHLELLESYLAFAESHRDVIDQIRAFHSAAHSAICQFIPSA